GCLRGYAPPHRALPRSLALGFRMNASVSPHSLPPASSVIATLRAEGLSKAYGPITVLSDVTLDVRPGEIHAVIGENGAGKSTLRRLLSGHVAPTSGELCLAGSPIRFKNAVEAGKAGSVLVRQEILRAPELTGAEYLFLGHEVGRGLFTGGKGMSRKAAELRA